MDYRALDPARDWDFFVEGCPVPADCLPLIRPLREDSARGLWREFISPPPARHPVLSADAWPSRLLSSPDVVEWHSAWNNDRDTDFIALLRSALAWPDGTSALFTWSEARSIETSWENFCCCWRCFLFEDEGPILWSLQSSRAVRFMASGRAYIGERLAIGAAQTRS